MEFEIERTYKSDFLIRKFVFFSNKIEELFIPKGFKPIKYGLLTIDEEEKLF